MRLNATQDWPVPLPLCQALSADDWHRMQAASDSALRAVLDDYEATAGEHARMAFHIAGRAWDRVYGEAVKA